MKGVMTVLCLVTGALVGVAGTYLPNEGDVDVSVYQTTGLKPFREIQTSPFTPHAYTNRVPTHTSRVPSFIFATRASTSTCRFRSAPGR